MAELTIDDRVALGAAWLDEVVPGWEERIDPETLDLSSRYQCICGQVFSDDQVSSGYDHFSISLYDAARDWLDAHGGTKEFDAAAHLGFDRQFRQSDWDATFDVLTDAWRRLLAERGVTARDALTTTGGRGDG